MATINEHRQDPRVREAALTIPVYGQLPFVPERASGCDIFTRDGRRILDLYADMNDRQNFNKGDLVTWKPGLKNGKYPEKNYPAIVTRIYDKPLSRDDMESGSNHYREPLDLVIMVDTGDEVSEFHVDSRRFRLYDGAIEGEAA